MWVMTRRKEALTFPLIRRNIRASSPLVITHIFFELDSEN